MCDLSIKYAIAMNAKLTYKCARVLAEIMENLNDLAVFEDLLQFLREWVDLGEIENVAAISQSNLKKLWLSV